MIRIIVGLGILSLLFLLDEPTKWWGLIGGVPLGTGLLGWPPYAILGISTCKN